MCPEQNLEPKGDSQEEIRAVGVVAIKLAAAKEILESTMLLVTSIYVKYSDEEHDCVESDHVGKTVMLLKQARALKDEMEALVMCLKDQPKED